ncbi:prephenate dehydrogenase [bacterium]|nr:prephenate dehydrogenase [bacterium]
MNTDAIFKKIAILGVGLIGGSLGLAIKRKQPGSHIIGISSPGALEGAIAIGAIDEAVRKDHLERGIYDADLVILCNPIQEILQRLPEVAGAVKPGALVTDAGSTKLQIFEKAKFCMDSDSYFIGGHPMAGSEARGIQAADALLFENAVYVLTPLDNTPEDIQKKMISLVECIGAKAIFISPDLHDRIAAAVSHVPQILAVTLMNLISKPDKSSLHLKLAAGGFRDMTRIASSPYDIWEDIITTNQQVILETLDEFIRDLQQVKLKMKTLDLSADFQQANTQRLSIPRDTKGFIHPHFDLLVRVEDKPGIIAALSTALAAAAINIKDIEVLKVREGDAGTIRLSLETPEARKQAQSILKEAGFNSLLVK